MTDYDLHVEVHDEIVVTLPHTDFAGHLPCCLIGSNGEVPGPDEVFRIVSYEVVGRASTAAAHTERSLN
jgi:hypothetical protein